MTHPSKDFIQACNYFFTGKRQVPSNEQARIIFVFGSPGAGKSTNIKPLLLKDFAISPVCIEIDELKAFLPKDQEQDAQLTDEWFNQMVKEAINLRYNLVIFRLRNMLLPTQTQNILKQAKNNGYQTEIDILALDRKRSTLGMIHRYELALEKQIQSPQSNKDIANYPRPPQFLKHYMFFKVLPIVTKWSQNSDLVDKINVYDREGHHLAWQDKRNQKTSNLSPIEALRQERHRHWHNNEKVLYEEQHRQAFDKMKSRKASLKEILVAKMLTFFGRN